MRGGASSQRDKLSPGSCGGRFLESSFGSRVLIANIAAYKFVTIDDTDGLRTSLRELCLRLHLKGTILLAPEGINLFLAGSSDATSEFLANLPLDKRFEGIEAKWSWSDFVPFKRLRVKLKAEIVTLRLDGLDPVRVPAPLLSAAELKNWFDEGRDFVLLDTRNEWEITEGTFENALNPHLRSFGEFPQSVDALADLRDKTIVTFCTGGIRCEKAAPLLLMRGFRQVYQLQGGILKYFEECGGAHWRGNCVVFDDRGALDSQLRPAAENIKPDPTASTE